MKATLNENGLLFSSIDENEVLNLKSIVGMLFPKGNLLLPAITNLKGNQDTEGFVSTHEYIICGANNSLAHTGRLPLNNEDLVNGWKDDDYGLYKKADGLRATGANAPRHKRPNLWYPIFINQETKEFYTTEDDNPKRKEDIILLPINDDGVELSWYWGKGKVNREKYNLILTENKGKFSLYKKQRPKIGDLPTKKPKSFFYKPSYSSTNGGNIVKNIFGNRMSEYTPKSVSFLKDISLIGSGENDMVMDCFAGSGTLGQAIIELNKEDKESKRKYILMEMGDHMKNVILPRLKKVIYSDSWNKGKPTTRNGSSHIFKYVRLESYEDTLNNLRLVSQGDTGKMFGDNPNFHEDYMLGYMLDFESRESLLNVGNFDKPFDYTLSITANNESQDQKVDMVETFNYLLGLKVKRIWTEEGFKIVSGENRKGESILVIWRNMADKDDVALTTFCQSKGWHKKDNGFDLIYINGGNTLESFKEKGAKWRSQLIETTFHQLMFDIKDV